MNLPPKKDARTLKGIVRKPMVIALGLILSMSILMWWQWVYMPNSSKDAFKQTSALNPLAVELRETVTQLVHFGERRIGTQSYGAALDASKEWLLSEMNDIAPTDQEVFTVDGEECVNLVLDFSGTQESSGLIVIGAHYDSAHGTAGANDNASGVAVMLALAKLFKDRRIKNDLRFVAFTNEEMPHFRDGSMGSQWHAQRLKKDGTNVLSMISLETMGYFSNETGSQKYPTPLSMFYPERGNFLAFVGNHDSRSVVHRAIASFRKSDAALPSEGASLPGAIPGVGWSDHSSFWSVGYPALMVTDTAPFRYPHYHMPTDTPDKIDYHRLAAATLGLVDVVSDFANHAD